MIVQAHIAGIFGDKPIMSEREVELDDDADLKTFFKKADKAFGFSRPKIFRLALKMSIQPVILLNGERVDLPEGLKHRLSHGDEITVISPLAGG